MRKVILGAAAATMLAGSSMAQAAPAVERTSAPVEASEQLGGATWWLGLLGAALLVFVLVQINESDEIDLPTSP